MHSRETSTKPASKDERHAAHAEQALILIQESLRGLRYGHVTIVVQDGFVVNIERSEKRRVV